MAGVKALQTNLAASLDAIGYKKRVATLPASLEQSRKLSQFVELTIDHIKPDNYLSTEQSKSLEGIKSAGKALEGRVLENALRNLGVEGQKPEDIEKEVADMTEKATNLRKQLQTLNSVQKSLNEHYADLLHKRDDLTRQKSDMLKHQHSAQQRAEVGNRKLDAAVEDLMEAVRDVCAFHRQEGAGTRTTPPKFLSDMSQDDFHQAEDQYLNELTAYTKKQFFKGLVDIAHSRAPGEDGAKFTQVDLDDSDQVILMGVSEEQYQKHCQELSRLRALYPLTEVQYINVQLAKRHTEAATSRARQELEALSQVQAGDLNSDLLRQHYAERQQKIEGLRARVQELGQTQLTSLLQDMAALQVTRVLHGDYDLKIARQDYFASKQDKVISQLQSQRSRHELLSMLYEVELRKHRDTHRLLLTAEKQLTQLKEEGEGRNTAMQSPSLRQVNAPRASIDSNDASAGRLCSMLGVKPSSSIPVLTQSSLHKAVEQLAHQIAMLQGILKATDTEINQLSQEQQSLTAAFERELFGHNNEGQVGQPVLTVDAYAEQCSKLRSVVTTLEQNIKTLLKDYDGKKKMLQANPLLETERKLFISFFTEPGKFSQIVSDLAKRVDSVALANE